MAGGAVTEAGVRANIRVALAYLDSWLRGIGAAAIDNLMEDAATAEISRSQLWLWITQGVVLDGGTVFDPDRYAALRDEELDRLGGSSTGRLAEAAGPARPARPGRRLRRVPDAAGVRAARLMVPDWPSFYEATKGREPRPLLPRALAAWGDRPAGVAVDLGAGDGTETFALLAAGWHVSAVDSSPAAASLMRERVAPAHAANLEIRTVPIEAATLPAIDLVYAAVQPAVRPAAAFPATWTRIRGAEARSHRGREPVRAVRHLGRTIRTMNFQDRGAVEGLLRWLGCHRPPGVRGGRQRGRRGPKHWHVIEFVARRPADG